MKALVLSIEVDDIDGEPEEDYTPSPSGQVKVMVNGKEMVVTIHECGELDLDGPVLTEEENTLLWDTLTESKAVQAAFPPDLY